MIDLWQYHSLADKRQFLSEQDLRQKTLVVSDLSSKLHWQKFLLEKQGYLAGYQVLRAQDFWQVLLQRADPQLEVVSASWMLTFLRKALTEIDLSRYGLPYTKPGSLLEILTELSPILAHADSVEIMENWFSEIKESQCSWQNWFYLCSDLWIEIKKSKHIIAEWVGSFLIENTVFENFWQTDLIFDLGPEIRTIEVDLMKTLSRRNNVMVLAPNPSWLKDFNWISYPYLQFTQDKHRLNPIPKGAKAWSNSHFKRFGGTLAEVKFVVGQIRDWLACGRQLSEIAVITSDLETYWPALRWHLKKENIPFAKAETIRAGTLAPFIAWMSHLKKICGIHLKASELALANFHPLNYSNASYLEHLRLWSKRPDVPEIAEASSQNLLSAEDFIKWAYQSWDGKHYVTENIRDLCRRWLYEARAMPALKQRDWIDYLEAFFNQMEITPEGETQDGVAFYSLMNGVPASKKLRIFLGCAESQLKSSSGIVKGSEVLSLQHHTGHLLAHPDRDFRSFQLQLLLNDAEQEYFTFAESDFKGSEQVPSVFWLKGRENEGINFHDLDTWSSTYWEQEQRSATLSAQNIEAVRTTTPWNFTLSPGSLESYHRCPFRFFAEKGLKLDDPALVDLDLDARTQGSINHRLLELLLEEPFSASELRKKLPVIIEGVLGELEDSFYSPATKAITKIKLEKFADRFLTYEETYRAEHHQYSTVARESWFRRPISARDKEITFRGKIDRIDVARDSGEAVVVDYKSDIVRLHQPDCWLEMNEFQLLAYTDSVEKGYASAFEDKNSPPFEVIGAHYLSLKDFSRKGFTLNEATSDIAEISKAKSRISREEKQKLLDQFNALLKNSAEKIVDGQFHAIPHPKTECRKCPWRNLCRAPKQNL